MVSYTKSRPAGEGVIRTPSAIELTDNEIDYIESVPAEEAQRMIREVGFAAAGELEISRVDLLPATLAIEDVEAQDVAVDVGHHFHLGYLDGLTYADAINTVNDLEDRYPSASKENK